VKISPNNRQVTDPDHQHAAHEARSRRHAAWHADTIPHHRHAGGVPLGEFRTFSGGELTSADVKSARGAGQTERSRGGRKTIGNVTISRECDRPTTTPGARPAPRQARPVRHHPPAARRRLQREGQVARPTPARSSASPRATPTLGGDGLDDLELEMSVSEVA
jgi:hypothetical protein